MLIFAMVNYLLVDTTHHPRRLPFQPAPFSEPQTPHTNVNYLVILCVLIICSYLFELCMYVIESLISFLYFTFFRGIYVWGEFHQFLECIWEDL
jgi:hypothetical protein